MVALMKPDNRIVDTIIHGDALEMLSTLADNSIDALCCDPPAGIGFMNKPFDDDRGGRKQWVAWLTEIMIEALRVMKPGSYGFVWALPRTSHWTALALEDAGFTIREKCYHLFGSGFPKSKNLGNGVGSALKPAVEEWILCRKPLSESSLAANYAKWGTSGLNIDQCRVATPEGLTTGGRCVGESPLPMNKAKGYKETRERSPEHPQGRFPSNLLLSHSWLCTDELCDEQCPIRLLDEQSGIRPAGYRANSSTKRDQHQNMVYGKYQDEYTVGERGYKDQGGASRYFTQFCYTAKASRAERNRGCEGLQTDIPDAHNLSSNACGRCGLRVKANGSGKKCECNDLRETIKLPAQANSHPCVKPIALMSWLCRLITPPGGTVLDCFAGSGSTLCAAIYEGFHFIGIEQEASYVEIARARVRHAWEVHP